MAATGRKLGLAPQPRGQPDRRVSKAGLIEPERAPGDPRFRTTTAIRALRVIRTAAIDSPRAHAATGVLKTSYPRCQDALAPAGSSTVCGLAYRTLQTAVPMRWRSTMGPEPDPNDISLLTKVDTLGWPIRRTSYKQVYSLVASQNFLYYTFCVCRDC